MKDKEIAKIDNKIVNKTVFVDKMWEIGQAIYYSKYSQFKIKL